MSGVFQAVLARDVIVETDDGHRITFDRIRRYAALSESDYDDAMRTARQHNVLAWIGYWFAGPPTQGELDRAEELLAERWNVAIEDVTDRAHELDLDRQGLHEFLVRDALVHRMESSYLGRTQHGVITKLFLDELRKRGRYEEVKHAAALQESLSRSVITDGDISPQQALASHISLSQWQLPNDLNQYVEDNELGSVGELLQSVITSVQAYQALFGTGLLPDVGEGVEFFDTGEPMMTRGN
jgi:hypothetical protein